jgi:quercetin dioxygenase-like cupin family protein/ribosome-binding protein aMBF1 (putative translation factor)
MDQEKKQASYDSFRQAVDQYSEDKGHDLLTDPDAVAAAKERVEDEQAATHGQRLRAAREARGFTLAELAEKTGTSAEDLAQVEAGETLLPLGQLIKLSKILSLKMSEMISAGEEAFTIVRAGQRRTIDRFGKAKQAGSGYEYESLAPGKKGRLMEPFIVTLLPGASAEQSTHDGQEFIYVLEGVMEVLIEDKSELLQPGDAVYYDSTTNHLVRAHGANPAKILAVLVS